MRIAVIESVGANFLSVTTALEYLGVDYQLTNDKEIIQSADAVIMPGVGFAKFAMQKLQDAGLNQVIKDLKQPVLGICLGMQLFYEYSEEGDINCLGIIPGSIKKFDTKDKLVVPHMGWNSLDIKTPDPIVNGIKANDVYFVHSYYAPINEQTITSTDYGHGFTSIAKYNNFYGMQFHPEKSGETGSRLLKNFLDLARI